jgi:hypothetical protein
MAATTKIVNGVPVDITGTPEATAIENEWAANPPPTAQQMLDAFRARAAALIDQVQDVQAVKDRAILLVVMDELNSIRQWVTDFKAAVAAATSLANLQTRVAATSNLPQRTANQIRPAVQGKMTDGSADN